MKPTYNSPFQTRLTNHAACRARQRNIPLAAIDLLLDYAEPIPAGDGALSYRFTQRSWAEARTFLGARLIQFEKYRNAYVVEAADGVIITAAWLH